MQVFNAIANQERSKTLDNEERIKLENVNKSIDLLLKSNNLGLNIQLDLYLNMKKDEKGINIVNLMKVMYKKLNKSSLLFI